MTNRRDLFSKFTENATSMKITHAYGSLLEFLVQISDEDRVLSPSEISMIKQIMASTKRTYPETCFEN